MSAKRERFVEIVRWVVLVGGVGLAALAVWLPVDAVVARAIPPSVLQTIEAAGHDGRLQELQAQFTVGLNYFRCALGVFALWCVMVGLLWTRLLAWAGQLFPLM